MKEEDRLPSQLSRDCWADEPERWMAYLEKQLSSDDHDQMQTHLDQCSSCVELLEELQDFFADSDASEMDDLLPGSDWYLAETNRHQSALNLAQISEAIFSPFGRLKQTGETVLITIRSVAPVLFLVCFFASSLWLLQSIRPSAIEMQSSSYPDKNIKVQSFVNAADQLDPMALARHQGYAFYDGSKTRRIVSGSGDSFAAIGHLRFSSAPFFSTGF